MKKKFRRSRGIFEKFGLFKFLCFLFGCRWDRRLLERGHDAEDTYRCPRCDTEQNT